MDGLKLDLKSKKIIIIILALFVALSVLFFVLKLMFPADDSAAAIQTSRVEKKTVINLSSGDSNTDSTYNADNNENNESTDSTDNAVNIEAKPFTNEAELAFEQGEYSAEIYSSVDIKLLIKSSSIPSVGIEWTLSDKDAGELTVTNGTNAVLSLKKTGEFEVKAALPSGLYAVCRVASHSPDEYRIEDVPFISQNGKYPSGCESISTTMLLQYYNYKITPETFIDGYLHTDYLRESKDGTSVVGPDPYTAFIGSPYLEASLGCYPPVIVDALNKIFDETTSKNTAVNTTGKSLQELIDTYIVQDEPVLVWATMNLWQPVETDSWIVEGASEKSPYKDGDLYKWIANEHCLVLTGYDENYYYFNDPLYYKETVKYEKSAFEQRFEEIGKCSAAINGGVLSGEISVKLPQKEETE
ncbi:MAG: C39 family peptidase [Acutalibacteraceae bacterium]